jgi:hypothetical protein
MKPRKGYNPKRKIAPIEFWTPEERAWRLQEVRYGGNPEHKLNPRDYGLSFINPRPAKTLCDADGPFPKAEAERLLREAISKGMVRHQTRGGWPQNVWAVSEQGEPFEAQLEHAVAGVYHGYPMPRDDDFRDDDFRDEVLQEWVRR